MDINEYQKDAKKTDVYPESNRLTCLIMGLTSEAGEVAGVMKKFYRDNTEPQLLQRKLLDEMGDVLWYLARLADEIGFTMSDVAERNLDKLRVRNLQDRLHGGAGSYPRETEDI